jgi:cytochrome c peroxidase
VSTSVSYFDWRLSGARRSSCQSCRSVVNACTDPSSLRMSEPTAIPIHRPPRSETNIVFFALPPFDPGDPLRTIE